jgi:chitinase
MPRAQSRRDAHWWLFVVLFGIGASMFLGCASGAGPGRSTAAGSAGAGGASATSGTGGDTGATGGGTAGSSGTAADAGASGAPGSAGAIGAAGTTASAGAGGAAGMNGAAGAGGAAGMNGAAGTNGAASTLVFGPYKDTSINMDWNTNTISTKVGGDMASFAADMSASGKGTVTLAFATGECGGENWGGVKGEDLASVNVPLFMQAGIRYVVSTGGAAGSFTCGTDAGMTTFIDRWNSANLVGIDFDIEVGQSPAVIGDLMARIKAAHGKYPKLRFSLTLATLAPSTQGQAAATSLGLNAQDGFNVYGDDTMAAVKSTLGFSGAPATWPSYVTVNLMTMDYGTAGPGICVVSNGACEMGQSAIQAAYNLRDKWGVPLSAVELTPMIGGNDAVTETFTPANADTVAHFAMSQGLAGVHYWSYDRDVDCMPGYASPTCNSIGGVGAHGYLKRFMAAGLK